MGRFIFQHIIKVLAAEIFMNYDIKPVEQRPRVSCMCFAQPVPRLLGKTGGSNDEKEMV